MTTGAEARYGPAHAWLFLLTQAKARVLRNQIRLLDTTEPFRLRARANAPRDYDGLKFAAGRQPQCGGLRI